MSCHTNMMPQQVSALKKFVEDLRTNPEILHAVELAFFREYIESLGGKIPEIESDKTAPKEKNRESCPFSDAKKAKDDEPEKMEDEEEDILDFVEQEMPEDLVGKEGVIEPESDRMPEVFEYNGEEIEEAALEKSNELRSQAMSEMSEGKFSEAVDIFTEAIKMNPESAVLYAKRANALLKQKRVKAVIADCDEAIKRNPDSAPAHKVRGRAHRLLGEWLKAAQDLRKACKLDCDEQAMEWLSEVQANATKIEEYERGQQRARADHELLQRQQRVRRAKKAQEEARKKNAEESKNSPDLDDEGMGGLGGFFSDPDLLSSLQDPEVSAAFSDIMQNPMNIMKYKDNPKIMKLMAKMKGMGAGLGGGMPGGMGGMPGFGGMPGGMGGFPGGMGGAPPSGGSAPPPPSNTADDLD